MAEGKESWINCGYTRDERTKNGVLFSKYIKILHRNECEKYEYVMADNYVLQNMKARLGELVSNTGWMV